MRSIVDQLRETVATPEESPKLVPLPLDLLEPDPEQPRKSFEGIEELAESITAVGIRQPLLVRLHPEKPGSYLIVAGERRWRAAKRARLTHAPCQLIADAEELGRRQVIQLTENLLREDVPILETAHALQGVLARTSMSKQELAKLLGKKPSFVSKHLALLKAQGHAADALAEGLILSTETFRLFEQLPDSRQRILLSQARRLQVPISRSDVVAAADVAPESVRQGNSEPRPQRFKLQLTAVQVRWLLEQLGKETPEDSELGSALLRLFEDSPDTVPDPRIDGARSEDDAQGVSDR